MDVGLGSSAPEDRKTCLRLPLWAEVKLDPEVSSPTSSMLLVLLQLLCGRSDRADRRGLAFVLYE